MNKADLRIVYMGTPEFAVESLRRLVEGGYNVVGVITMPDKPAGRGHKLQASPVKQYAQACNLPLLQPERLKDEVFLDALRSWHADLQIVVAFRMLPEVVWSMPRWGTFNLHASLLPQYRGAAPINRAIINGETETGVTTFFLQQEIDTGNVIRQVRTPIADTDNAGTLHDRLMLLGAQAVVDTVADILADNIRPVPQAALPAAEPLRTAPKIFKEDCRVDWHQPAAAIHNFVRGLAPYPAAWTELTLPDGEIVPAKLFETRPLPAERSSAPSAEPAPFPSAETLPPAGTVRTDGKSYLHIVATDGFVDILSLQLPGKKRMATGEWLRGMRF
ncbi:MAG: methionyl-tRNA formyltransferase [Prevotellaceae bacterium]|jgi:methionyl-tRNA formyltransferase|nr:methionyl-tRNA formyltransferase [Prevotellaceae bacterium]